VPAADRARDLVDSGASGESEAERTFLADFLPRCEYFWDALGTALMDEP
jgi:hypothetical protein